MKMQSSSLFAAADKDSAAAPAKAEPKVKVRVLSAAVGEAEGTFEKGAVFETTATRAAALGDSVELVK